MYSFFKKVEFEIKIYQKIKTIIFLTLPVILNICHKQFL